jgi:hypothetical protein
LKNQIDEQIRQNWRSTLDELHEKFPQISRSLLHEISASVWRTKKFVQGGCHGCWQTTTKKRMDAALTFLERYHRDGDKFLDNIVIGDETWGFSHHPREQASVARRATSSIAFKTQEG